MGARTLIQWLGLVAIVVERETTSWVLFSLIVGLESVDHIDIIPF